MKLVLKMQRNGKNVERALFKKLTFVELCFFFKFFFCPVLFCEHLAISFSVSAGGGAMKIFR